MLKSYELRSADRVFSASFFDTNSVNLTLLRLEFAGNVPK